MLSLIIGKLIQTGLLRFQKAMGLCPVGVRERGLPLEGRECRRRPFPSQVDRIAPSRTISVGAAAAAAVTIADETIIQILRRLHLRAELWGRADRGHGPRGVGASGVRPDRRMNVADTTTSFEGFEPRDRDQIQCSL